MRTNKWEPLTNNNSAKYAYGIEVDGKWLETRVLIQRDGESIIIHAGIYSDISVQSERLLFLKWDSRCDLPHKDQHYCGHRSISNAGKVLVRAVDYLIVKYYLEGFENR